MYRDVEELPAILSELEDGGRMIDAHQWVLYQVRYIDDWNIVSTSLLAAQDIRNNNLVHLSSVLDDLEELGDIMEEMLQNQEEVEVNLLCHTDFIQLSASSSDSPCP